MRPRSLALLLLLALGLRLGAGPHPCHAMAAPAPAMAHASCHQEQEPKPKAPVPGDEDCCKNGDALCEHACQTAAVFQVAFHALTPLAFQEQAAASEHRVKPPVAFAIDHVPLV